MVGDDLLPAIADAAEVVVLLIGQPRHRRRRVKALFLVPVALRRRLAGCFRLAARRHRLAANLDDRPAGRASRLEDVASTDRAPGALLSELGALLGAAAVASPSAAYLADATEWRGLRGSAEAVVFPESTDQVARVLAWCSRHDVAVTPRGGGSGLAGGAVPTEGGVVLALERMTGVRSFEPELWRIELEAGVRTRNSTASRAKTVCSSRQIPARPSNRRSAATSPTNAGGPHAFKYGVTRAWVSGLEVVLADGPLVTLGGAVRKDVAGYDLLGLIVRLRRNTRRDHSGMDQADPGSRTRRAAARRDLPDSRLRLRRVRASSVAVSPWRRSTTSTGRARRATASGFPGALPPNAGFMVITEADGERGREAERICVDAARGARRLGLGSSIFSGPARARHRVVLELAATAPGQHRLRRQSAAR